MPDELRYYVTPHPLREGRLLMNDLYETEQLAHAAARGGLRRRVVLHPVLGGADHGAWGAEVAAESRESQDTPHSALRTPHSELAADLAPPAEQDVRRAEGRLRRLWLGRSRLAGARALLWRLLGLSLVLVWVNYAWVVAAALGLLPLIGAPLAEFAGTLGYSAGGPVLATVVALIPLFWAWGRAAGHAAEARRYGRASRALASRRFAAAALEFQPSADGAGFAAEAVPVWRELRRLPPELEEHGTVAAGDLARACRTAYQLARRHRWEGAADAMYALYSRFDALERRLSRLEAKAAEGVLAARRAQKESEKALRAATARLAPYAVAAPAGAAAGGPRERVPGPGLPRVASHGGRPVLAGVAGVAVLAAAAWVTGLYYVGDGTAVIVDPVEARVARLAQAIGESARLSGLPLFGAVRPQDLPIEADDQPGLHWTLPRPFTARHTVSLEPQLLPVQAVFRQIGPETVEVAQVVMIFRIADVERWARLDRDGRGTLRLSQQLSDLLQTVIQSQRRAVRLQIAQQDPQLARDETEVVRRADAFLAPRMEEIVGAFVQSVGRSELPREVGIQFGEEFRAQLARRTGPVPAIE